MARSKQTPKGSPKKTPAKAHEAKKGGSAAFRTTTPATDKSTRSKRTKNNTTIYLAADTLKQRGTRSRPERHGDTGREWLRCVRSESTKNRPSCSSASCPSAAL